MGVYIFLGKGGKFSVLPQAERSKSSSTCNNLEPIQLEPRCLSSNLIEANDLYVFNLFYLIKKEWEWKLKGFFGMEFDLKSLVVKGDIRDWMLDII